MANVIKRKGMGILSAIFAFGAIIMIAAALSTQYWVNADLVYKTVSTGNQSTQETNDGGQKHFGLFSGSTTTNVGLGNRARDFKGNTCSMLEKCIYTQNNSQELANCRKYCRLDL